MRKKTNPFSNLTVKKFNLSDLLITISCKTKSIILLTEILKILTTLRKSTKRLPLALLKGVTHFKMRGIDKFI